MKKQKQRAATIFTTDHDGRRIAHVALAGTNERTKMLAEDLERILTDGYSQFWTLVSTGSRVRYVLVNVLIPKEGQRTTPVARLVARAGKGQIVKYADGDRLNLLPENLLVKKGNARTPVTSLLPQADARQARMEAHAPQSASRTEVQKIHRKFPQGYMTI